MKKKIIKKIIFIISIKFYKNIYYLIKNMQNQPPVDQDNSQMKPRGMKHKQIFGIDFSEFELFSIRMISDYLFLDRFNDSASFVRFEQCFGPLFSSKNKQFKLVEAFKEIVGPKRKYLTFKRMIKAYINWKLKKSQNYSFNFFMTEVFQKMIKKRGEVVGELVEGQRVFSTKNCRNRKIITKFSVLTDESKNKIKGFVIEYDTVFKAILCKQLKKDDIHLEINFGLFHAQGDKLSREFQLDRDGISHMAGKYDKTSGNIKFLIFKCRSGKTLYIGDPKETEEDNIIPFIFGSSKCQLKTMTIELINDQLAYIQPKYQISTRKNDNLDIEFDNLDENYLNNDPPKYEETDLEGMPDDQFKDDKQYLFPLVPDDQFVDKMSLVESNCGKDFKEVYNSLFDKEEKNAVEKFRNSIKKLLEDTINSQKREEKLKNEQKNLVLRESYYRKNDFESVFVKMIKMKKNDEASKDSQNNEENEYIEEDDEEDELNLVKIKTGEYTVKEKSEPLRAKAEKKEEEKKVEEKKEKEPQDNLSGSKEPQDNLAGSKVVQNRRNHKVVEIKQTSHK